MIEINKILDEARALGCSDLHFTTEVPPVVRLHGSLKQMSNYPVLTNDVIVDVMKQMTNDEQKASIEKNIDTDFSFSRHIPASLLCHSLHELQMQQP